MTMLKNWIIILLFSFINHSTIGFKPVDYCNICKCDKYSSFGCTSSNKSGIKFDCQKGKHILCLRPSSRPVSPCNVWKFGLGSQRYLLNIFNGWRDHVAAGNWMGADGVKLPPAANMMRLEWDLELVFLATRTLNECADFDSSRYVDYCRDSGRFPVAAYKSSGPIFTPESLLESTIKMEKGNITSSLLTITCEHIGKFFPGMFFQKAIWATSRYIGCAYAERSHYAGPRYMITCYLGPTGNGSWLYQLYKGQKAYEEGTPQSKCPRDAFPDTEFKSLCRELAFKGKPSGHWPEKTQHGINSGVWLVLILIFPILTYCAQMAWDSK